MSNNTWSAALTPERFDSILRELIDLKQQTNEIKKRIGELTHDVFAHFCNEGEPLRCASGEIRSFEAFCEHHKKLLDVKKDQIDNRMQQSLAYRLMRRALEKHRADAGVIGVLEKVSPTPFKKVLPVINEADNTGRIWWHLTKSALEVWIDAEEDLQQKLVWIFRSALLVAHNRSKSQGCNKENKVPGQKEFEQPCTTLKRYPEAHRSDEGQQRAFLQSWLVSIQKGVSGMPIPSPATPTYVLTPAPALSPAPRVTDGMAEGSQQPVSSHVAICVPPEPIECLPVMGPAESGYTDATEKAATSTVSQHHAAPLQSPRSAHGADRGETAVPGNMPSTPTEDDSPWNPFSRGLPTAPNMRSYLPLDVQVEETMMDDAYPSPPGALRPATLVPPPPVILPLPASPPIGPIPMLPLGGTQGAQRRSTGKKRPASRAGCEAPDTRKPRPETSLFAAPSAMHPGNGVATDRHVGPHPSGPDPSFTAAGDGFDPQMAKETCMDVAMPSHQAILRQPPNDGVMGEGQSLSPYLTRLVMAEPSPLRNRDPKEQQMIDDTAHELKRLTNQDSPAPPSTRPRGIPGNAITPRKTLKHQRPRSLKSAGKKPNGSKQVAVATGTRKARLTNEPSAETRLWNYFYQRVMRHLDNEDTITARRYMLQWDLLHRAHARDR